MQSVAFTREVELLLTDHLAKRSTRIWRKGISGGTDFFELPL